MSRNKKDKVQVKLELEGAIKDFLEEECSLECRSLTAHVRYIVNRYYMERNGTLGGQTATMTNLNPLKNNFDTPTIQYANDDEQIVRNTNFNEQNNPITNNYEQGSNENSQQGDVLEKEDFTYINSDVLDF